MEGRLSKAEWVDQFGEALMRLQPTMNAVTAAANAVDAYRMSFDTTILTSYQLWFCIS